MEQPYIKKAYVKYIIALLLFGSNGIVASHILTAGVKHESFSFFMAFSHPLDYIRIEKGPLNRFV